MNANSAYKLVNEVDRNAALITLYDYRKLKLSTR